MGWPFVLKIMTRYTCAFLPRIIAIFPALWVFPQVCVHFRLKRPLHANIRLANAHLYAHNTSPPYTCVTNKHLYYRVTESCRITDTELYRQ